MDSTLLIIVGLWLAAIVVLLPIVIVTVTGKKRYKKKAYDKLEKLSSAVGKQDSRLQIVRSHAIDYLNSLGPIGAKNMSEIQSKLSNVEMLADKAHVLAKSNSKKKIKLANDILDGKKSVTIEENGRKSEYTLNDNWLNEIEDLLQELGNKIAEASNNSKDTGIPTFGRQFKRETMHDLEQAGINIEEIRKDYS